MSNRTYLCGSNTDVLESDNLNAGELLEARYCIPLLWLALFQENDMHVHDGAPLLLTRREEAMANWESRKAGLARFLGEPSQEIIAAWESFIRCQSAPMFLLNTYELWLMDEQPGQLATDVRVYFSDLDAMCTDERCARDLAFVIQANRALCSFPYVGAAMHLCGYSIGTQVPWPEETSKPATFVLEAAGFLVEEVVPHGRPLQMEIAETLSRVRQRNLKPFACISANWCTPCLDMFDLFADPRLATTLQGVHLLKLDLEQWGNECGGIGVGELTSVPLLLELNGEGMVAGRRIDGNAWEESTAEELTHALKPFFQGQ
ncbi:MAG: hypothetical protein WKG03_09050 [Telluria sp.]